MKKSLTVLFLFLLSAGMIFAQGTIPVTFGVNMRIQTAEGDFKPGSDSISIAGNWQADLGDTNWTTCAFMANDDDNDTIYTVTLNFPDSLKGKSYLYKFIINTGGWEEGNDRPFEVPAAAAVFPVVYYSNDSVVTIQVVNTLNFTADLTSIYGTGAGYYDPDTDSIQVMGLDWVGAQVVGGNRTMVENPFIPGIFTASMQIRGVQGDSTKWKCRAYPAEKFFNTGWEVSTDKWHFIGDNGSVTDVPVFVPDVYPAMPALSDDVTILFQVNMNNAINVYDTSRIDPATIQFVGLKGQDSAMAAWQGDWVPADTSDGYLIPMFDNGTGGDKSAGDHVFSAYVTFPKGTTGGPSLYKYGAMYPGADTLRDYHPLDNEFPSNSGLNHVVNIKVGGVTEVYNDFGSMLVTDVKQVSSQLPASYELAQNFPNPFNPSTTIRYSVPAAGKVCLKVFNLLGQEVVTLYNGEQNAGTYEANFNASSFASGTYFYRLTTGDVSLTKKMILIK